MSNSLRSTSAVCAGEAADDLMRNALLASGCIITESVMIAGRPGCWIHSFNIRRPRWLSGLFGYGREQHLSITAEASAAVMMRGQVATASRTVRMKYSVGCVRTDGRGSFKQWQCANLSELLRTL